MEQVTLTETTYLYNEGESKDEVMSSPHRKKRNSLTRGALSKQEQQSMSLPSSAIDDVKTTRKVSDDGSNDEDEGDDAAGDWVKVKLEPELFTDEALVEKIAAKIDLWIPNRATKCCMGGLMGPDEMDPFPLCTQLQSHKAAKRNPSPHGRCPNKFTKFTRKHHCRCCGLVFCKRCTNQKRALPEG
jgi:hypothetical protein